MKNVFYSILMTLLVLPAFTPWLSHGVVHALHDHQESHHQSYATNETDHEHRHDAHDHDIQTQATNHHPISLDAVSFYSDFLHVDLQKVNQFTFNAPVPDFQDFDYTISKALPLPNLYELALVQSRAPPDWRRLHSEQLSHYLLTQRLRI